MDKKIYLNCIICDKQVVRYPSEIKHGAVGKFCSRACKGKYQSESLLGENNPNYDKRWSNDQRTAASDRQKKAMESPERRWQAGKANRGKKFSEEIRQNMRVAKNRPENRKGTPHTPESKALIGLKSKQKFTPEFKETQRKTFEELGYWTPLAEKDDRDVYYEEADWIARMFDVVDGELVSKYGVWSHKNLGGLVRDHKYSRSSGYKNKVFPEILRHPANCQLVTQSENIKLAWTPQDNIFTLDELFVAIRTYPHYWQEQDACIARIEQYSSGSRWENPHKKGGGPDVLLHV